MAKKYKLLKLIVRIFTPKNWRGHKRSTFFQRLLNDGPNPDEMAKDRGKILGIIDYESTSLGLTCHDLAAHFPYYPFEDLFSADVTKYCNRYCHQDFVKLHLSIKRNCSILSLLSGYGTYNVTLIYETIDGITHEKRYTKRIKL